VVSRGRNRANEQRAEPGVLAGNFTAHAEMNAFAALRRWDASGLHLYTTLEPCLMCAAAALTQRVAAIHLAAPDALFAGLDELWPLHPVTAARQPPRTGPLEGRLAAFAQLLPWSFILLWAPGGPSAATYRDADPALADLAAAIPLGGPLLDAKTAGASASAALAAIWADLPESR
jgi:tRNA(Arg) A34 adenosine deaminase TadA